MVRSFILISKVKENSPPMGTKARNPSERAQIVSLWILLEKTSSAIFGAPLVGYLTKDMLDEKERDRDAVQSQEKADVLAFNLFRLATFFWLICAGFWVLMIRFYSQEMETSKSRDGTNLNAKPAKPPVAPPPVGDGNRSTTRPRRIGSRDSMDSSDSELELKPLIGSP